MDKQAMAEMWDEFNRNNTWFAGIFNAFEGLTPQQAAWKPDAAVAGAGRHSIWQILNHISYWREVVVKRTEGKYQPSDDELARMNFEVPAEVSDTAWAKSRERLKRSHQLIRDVLEAGKLPWEKFKYTIPHDSYHVGQVTYLRAMQGLKAIE
jgi:uncharacterized damage-inducible protein DinB